MNLQTIQKLLSIANEALIELDKSGKILFVSENWDDLFGNTSSLLEKFSLTDIISPESKKAIDSFFLNNEETDTEQDLKLVLAGKEYAVKISLVKQDILDNSSTIVGRVKICKTIEQEFRKHVSAPHNIDKAESTEYEQFEKIKRLENELKISKNFFEQISETARIGAWEVFLDTMTSVWTDQTYIIHDLPIGTAINLENAINYYHPDHKEIVIDKVNRLINEGTAFEFRLKMITAKGRHIWVHAKGKRELRNGKPFKIYGVFQDITEQVEAEEVLMESEEKFRLISENSGDLICTHKPDGTYKYVSPSSQKLLGYKPTELIGQNPYSFFHDDDKERIKNESHVAVLEGRNPIIQYRYKRADGRYIWLETVSNPIISSGEVVSIITFSRDVTDRVKKEQILVDGEKRLKMALNVAKMGIWEWYVKENKIIWDENLEQIYGLAPGEYDGSFEMYERFIHPEDREMLFSKINEFAKSGNKEWIIRHKIIKKDGKEAWMEGIGEMFFDEEGKPTYMIGLTSDITQKVAAEKKISRLALVAKKTDNSVVITNKQREVEWVNEGFTKMTGYTLQEVLGKNPGDILQGKATDLSVVKWISKELDNAKNVTTELINYTNNRKPYWVAMDIQPIYDEEGNFESFISIQRDVTQKKEQEKEMTDRNKALKKTNQELDNFVYRVSHDLRAPVSSSLGLIDLAKGEFTEDKSEKEKLDSLSQYISLLNKSMVRMDGFIGDILDYSRNTRVTLQKEEVPLFELVNEILQQHRYMNGKRHNLKVENKIKPSTIVNSDRLRLNIILSNLISNSFKFYDGSKNNPYISISAKKNGTKVHLQVKDNGIGIPAKHHHKIFDMFYRASNQDVGSGLGLYIVRESIQRINGTINFVSEENKGTTFNLQIPI